MVSCISKVIEAILSQGSTSWLSLLSLLNCVEVAGGPAGVEKQGLRNVDDYLLFSHPLRNFKEFENPGDNLSLPDLSKEVSLASNTVGWVVWVVLVDGNFLAETHETKQRSFFTSPADAVVWLWVCGSSGNTEMLASWNMRNRTNITAVFILFTFRKETLLLVLSFISITLA